MDALRCCSGMLVINRYGGERALSSCRDSVVYKPEFCFSSSQKLMEFGFGFIRLKTHHHKPIFAVSPVSSEAQDIGTAGNKVEETNSLKTVHVKFSLQKQCLFGEQFLVVGDDPMLGSWDPASAVPLNWSDGHVWTVELEMLAEKEIRYKFILQGVNGAITWQSDPDRVVKTWETENVIAVVDDWENALLQKISEEKPCDFFEEVAGDFAERREQFVSDVTNGSFIGNNHSLPADKSPAEEFEGFLIANNIGPSNEKIVANTRDNTSQTKGQAEELEGLLIANNIAPSNEKIVANTGDNASQTMGQAAVGETRKEEDSRVAYIMEQKGAIPKKSKNGVHDVVIDDVRITTDDLGITYIAKDVLINEGGPVLVPGMTKLSMEVTNKPIQHEGKQSNGTDASLTGLDEAIEPKLPELDVKQEPDDTIHQEEKAFLQLDQEEWLHSKQTIPMDEEKEENEPEAVDCVLKNDIVWGHRTLQKFLNNLGLL